SQVAVVLQEASGPDAALVAYVVPDLSMAVGCGFEESSAAQGPEHVPEELVRRLRSCCQERLPAYMIPRDIVLLEKLPLTVNGKLDRRALPTPGRTRSGQEAAWREPETPLESQLCELFREVLQLDRVGAEDNFFALGGQSLLAMRLFAQISEGLQVRLPIEALFRSPTPRALAAFMTREPQSLVEEKLCLMFGQVLGRDDVGVHDNFFELGGHSLLAMRLHVEIAERLQVRLPIETLFRSPTPRALAALVQQHDPGAQVLVPIRPEGNARPLFLLPSATGNLLFWQRLVPHAPRQLPLWGLSPGWRAGDRVACRSLAEVVVPMVEAVLVHQRQGPIRLMGYSAGAHFAHEVARQLEARGRQVGFLGLVDAIPNKPRATWGAKLVRALRTLIDPRQWSSLRSRLSAIRQSNRHKKVPVKRRGLPDRFERMQDQFRQTRQRLVDLLNAHQPGRTQVPVTLFRVPPKVGQKRSPGLGWGHYCSRVTVIHLDDVEHEQIIRTEHIHTLARAVFQVLDCRPDGPTGTAIAEADFDSRAVSSEP
ncbi:MAG TPA: hypothetical protein DDY91_21260, partial [Planctomycetaceae bacterium]|nr:hypothetical protein [Planctomycetaceae bacterium]